MVLSMMSVDVIIPVTNGRMDIRYLSYSPTGPYKTIYKYDEPIRLCQLNKSGSNTIVTDMKHHHDQTLLIA